MRGLRLGLWILAGFALLLWVCGVFGVYRIGPRYVGFLGVAALAASGALVAGASVPPHRPRRRA